MYEVDYEYNGNNRTLHVEITDEMRGIGARFRGRSGERIEFNSCSRSHMTEDPQSNPDDQVPNLTGRFENCWTDRESGRYPQLTAQINQVGNYVHGWFQVDPVFAATVLGVEVMQTDAAVMGDFHGHADGSGRIAVRFDTDGRRRRFRTIPGRLEIRNRYNAYIHLDRRYTSTGLVPIRFDSMKLSKVSMRGAEEPRLPDWVLDARSNNMDMIRLAEEQPLRSDQIRALRDLVNNTIARRVKQIPHGSSRIERQVSAANLLHFMGQIISVRRIPLMQPGCQCGSLDMTNRLERCRCGIPFREDQVPLIKAYLLSALEKATVMIDRDPHTIIEALYNIIETMDTGRREYERFREFRQMFGPPELPEHLNRYEYRCTMTYGELSTDKLPLPIKIGGRLFHLRMTRYIRRDNHWVLDGVNDTATATFDGIMGLFGIEIGDSHIELPIPGDRTEFKLHTTRLWSWGNFPGWFEIFSSEAALKFPFGAAELKWEGNAITFSGSGALPPLIVEMEDSSGWVPDIDVAAGANFKYFKGYIFHPGRHYGHQTHSSDLNPLSTADARVNDSSQNSFEFNQPVFIQPNDDRSLTDGRTRLGCCLAKNLAFLQAPHSHLRIEGFTSRIGSRYHNHILSMRRSQFIGQTILDIVGERLAIPVARENHDANGGTFRLFGYGESQAREAGVENGTDMPQLRRVDVILNGQIALRMKVGDPDIAPTPDDDDED